MLVINLLFRLWLIKDININQTQRQAAAITAQPVPKDRRKLSNTCRRYAVVNTSTPAKINKLEARYVIFIIHKQKSLTWLSLHYIPGTGRQNKKTRIA